MPQITQTIDATRMVPMQGTVHPRATAENDRGRVADDFPMQNMLLLLHRPDAQEQALEAFMEEQTTPGSPNYHHWLTAEEFGQYGLASSDLATISSWLSDQGFTVNAVYSNGITIDFSGTAGQVRKAFNTEIHRLDVKGEAHIANMTVPQIPAALAPAVVGIVSLHDFRPHTNFKPKPDYTIGSGSSATHAVVPADLATIYNFTPLFNAGTKGAGQTIVLIEDTDVHSTSDISTFRSTFGLGAGTLNTVHPGSCSSPGIVPGNDGEANLDVEWAAAAAPAATLEVASCADGASFGGLIAMQKLLSAGSPPKIWSVSYGFCEAENGATANAAYVSTYQQAAAAGVSVFVSSGDEGASSCDANQSAASHGIGVSGFASTPYNVAVGGTDFGDTAAGTAGTYWNASNTSTFGSAKSYINEIPWNDSCAGQLLSTFEGFAHPYGSTGFCNDPTKGVNFLTTGSGSGGPSACATGTPSTSGVVSGTCHGTAKPSWQSGIVGNPSDGVRDIPDISLFAANGLWGHYYVYCYTGNASDGGASCSGAPSTWSGAGGTSFSAPIMAGIQALINEKTGASQGNPNPTLYQLAKSEYGATGSTSCNSSRGNTVGSSCIFYDVTQGDMDVNCTTDVDDGLLHNCYRPSGTNGVLSTSNTTYQPAYGTTTGWDFATGIGTVNVTNLVNAWVGASSPPAKLAFTVEPNASYASGAAITVKVSVEDASGNVVTTDTSTVTLSLSGGTVGATLGGTKSVAAVAGVATFSNLTVDKVGSGYTLGATDSTLTAASSSAFKITAGAATSLTLTTQPTLHQNIGAGATIAFVAHVQDAAGNPVSGNNIQLAIGANPGGSTLSVTASPINTDSSGNASFAGVSLNKLGTGYTLVATDNTTPLNATSNAFNIIAGTPTTITLTAQPATNANIAIGATIPITAHVADGSGNPVASQNVQLTIGTNPGGASLAVTTNPVNTDGSGNATFSGVSLDKLGTGYTLVATDNTTPLNVTSNSFNIVAGAPAQLLFLQQPTSGTAGVALTPAVTVEVLDAHGFLVTADGNSVTMSVVAGPGAFDPGTVATATFNNGIATFDSLIFDVPGST
ncbi:MAG TPA: protease pro-enzyme activation domain-containing protein, partial [Rudaea sp.]|nr:protease pro-enzyme activation domain-containing protein [Rudaea sp.]